MITPEQWKELKEEEKIGMLSNLFTRLEIVELKLTRVEDQLNGLLKALIAQVKR